jgi:hypothetical protein
VKGRLAAAVMAVLVLGACAGAPVGGSDSPVASSAGPTTGATPSTKPNPTVAATEDSGVPFPTGESLAALTSGTYFVGGFVPPFSIRLEGGGWNGTSVPGRPVLTRDTGYFTSLRFGRFEGTVVPNHCADGTTTIADDPASLVAWLVDIPALVIERTDVTVGGLSGVRLAIAATTKRPCTADPGKGAPEVLWVDPSPVGALSLDTGDSLVAYLLDDGVATVTIVVQTTEQELAPFLELAEPVVAGIEFRSGTK